MRNESNSLYSITLELSVTTSVSLLQEKLALCLEDFRQKQSKSLEMTCMRPEVTDSGPLSVARFILNVFEKVEVRTLDQTHS